ncbi:hypothetical protein COO09_21815 [Rhizorhabdus dicambivorans]|uniref:Cupin domain-containing protein n=1 Tax=Rhizorhabdus dicambivorans TaxID=1850238 RepID=A0A2A4FR32_9SPHN|nr:hypothetical protein COO09_21815 [Rhizorhabdus dicambivorans]
MMPDVPALRPIAEVISPERHHHFSSAELESAIRYIRIGDAASPQLIEIVYLPDTHIDVHAHEEDEIIYVLRGQILLGRRPLGPGGSVFVQQNTLYAFRAGPEGAAILIFRPRGGSTYISAEEFRDTATQRRNRDAASESQP